MTHQTCQKNQTQALQLDPQCLPILLKGNPMTKPNWLVPALNLLSLAYCKTLHSASPRFSENIFVRPPAQSRGGRGERGGVGQIDLPPPARGVPVPRIRPSSGHTTVWLVDIMPSSSSSDPGAACLPLGFCSCPAHASLAPGSIRSLWPCLCCCSCNTQRGWSGSPSRRQARVLG